MTKNPYKVLILGAGASCAYGFPLGSELRQCLLDIDVDTAEQAGIIPEYARGDDIEALINFQNSFRHSQMYSIDAFLGRRPEFVKIGKKCIATVLLERENSDALFAEENGKDHWYQFLFNHFAKVEWDDLTFNDTAIISFNYDRSLEHFLYVALQSTYGKSAREVGDRLNSLRIVHVYGSLCGVLPKKAGYITHDGAIGIEKVAAAAEGLIVIPEGRVDGQSLVIAREWLSGASAIGFLGFGFDSTNIERLAEGGACQVSIEKPNANSVRYICGTRIGIYDAEMEKSFLALTGQYHHRDEVANFMNLNCTDTLRATLLLDR